jgi:hypothetical protein
MQSSGVLRIGMLSAVITLTACGGVRATGAADQVVSTPLTMTPSQAPQSAPPGMIAVSVSDDTDTPLALWGQEFVLLPSDSSAAVLSAETATSTATHAGVLKGFLGSGSATWSDPTLARIVDVNSDGGTDSAPSPLQWVFVASQVYAGYPGAVFPGNGMTLPPAPLRHHYTVVLVNAITGAQDGAWDINGPTVSNSSPSPS